MFYGYYFTQPDLTHNLVPIYMGCIVGSCLYQAYGLGTSVRVYTIPTYLHTERNVGDKAKVLNTMNAEVAPRLIRRCMHTNQTYSMIRVITQLPHALTASQLPHFEIKSA